MGKANQARSQCRTKAPDGDLMAARFLVILMQADAEKKMHWRIDFQHAVDVTELLSLLVFLQMVLVSLA